MNNTNGRYGLNKKGQMSFAMKAILTILVLLICILIFSRVMKGSTKVVECTTRGGDCITGTCKFDQIALLANEAAGCKKGQICCINVSVTLPELPIDPGCKTEEEGTYLEGKTCKNSSLYICGPSGQCMTKCSYCALNFGTTIGKDVCKTEFNKFRDNALKNPNHIYSCSCSASNCTKEMITDGLCIKDYCPSKSTTASDYMCCTE
jgi:hypothetical protein